MTIEKLQNILKFQGEQRKTIEEWGQKRSFWLKVLRIDPMTAHNLFRKEIDDFAEDTTSFFRTHIIVSSLFIVFIIALLVLLVSRFGFARNSVLMLIGLVLQALGGGYIMYGFIFPVKGLRREMEPNPMDRDNMTRRIFIDPRNIAKSFQDIVEISNTNTKAMQLFQITLSKDQIIRSKLEFRRWIAQGVGFFIMVLGIFLQILGLII
jgi:hypothetical protein